MTERVGRLRAVVIDAADPLALATFWAAVLGTEIDATWSVPPDWYELTPVAGGAFLGFQPVSVAAAPRTRLRLDIEVEELTETTARIAALGATLIDVVHFRPGEEHRVFTDPEGNEFNLVLPFPADPPSYEVTGASPATDGTV